MTMEQQDELIPPIGAIPQGERMFRVNWVANLDRSPSGVPLHEAEYVARQGRGVRLIDIREPDEITGPLGYIPGSDWIPRAQARAALEGLPPFTPVVLISRGGERSATLAHELERGGLRLVASMRGGMIAWRALGFHATRDPAILERRGVLSASSETREREPGPLRADEIEAHVGDPRSTRWLKLAAILLHGRQACVDGRDDSSVVGTPGGDAGEFVLGLAALEGLLGRALSPGQIEELFRRRLDTFGRFYLHSDINAANGFIKSMRSDERLTAAIGSTFEALEWRRWLSEPPVAARETIFEHICQPAHIGCGHLRLMTQHPAQYGVRGDLVQQVLHAFFTTRWAGAVELENVVLPGGHREGAVVNIRVEGRLHAYSWIPLISPAYAGTQMFVNHPQVSDYLRGQLAAFLADQTDVHERAGLEPEPLRRAICELAGNQLGATLGHLAGGLPIYDLWFHRDGGTRVEQVGVV